MDQTTYKKILYKYWGYPDFRGIQEEVIDAISSGQDVLTLMPTGGGKSLCYQVPGLAQEGVCVVISPLIALMKDQVARLESMGIQAASLVSGMTKREIDITLDNCIYGKMKFLYLSPERLKSDVVLERIGQMNVNLIAVDEAHCISQWGYDFRPAYLEIAKVRELKPDVPVLAVTATATPKVAEDIRERLQFEGGTTLVQGFARAGLSYSVLYEEGKQSRLYSILEKVPGTSIVYTRNRRKTREVATYLQKQGISADYYHAGLGQEQRELRQEAWTNGSTRVMVCTNAFGMGIDKPDVRTVVHMDLPDSLEAYFQEAGRAGRDGNKAFAILLVNASDKLQLEKQAELVVPTLEEIKNTYLGLANYFKLAVGAGEGSGFDFDITQFCNNYRLNPVMVLNCLKILEQQGYISTTDALFMPSRVMMAISQEDLYWFQVNEPKFEPLIKAILRTYGGVFEQFVPIREKDLATKLKMKPEEVIKYLQHLQKTDVLYYSFQKDKPQVIFTTPRVKGPDLVMDTDYLDLRRKSHKERISAVLGFIDNTSTCRSIQLLKYFGEDSKTRCGICDVCLGRNKLELNDKEYEKLKELIADELNAGPKPMAQLVSMVEGNDEQVIKTISWLRDNGRIIENDKRELIWQA